MKNLLHYAMIMALAFGIACEGPEGPPGPEGEPGTAGAPGVTGPQGPPGEAAANASVIDIGGWNFTPNEQGNYGLSLLFSAYGMELSATDVVMVYRLTAYDEQQELSFWAPLPQTLIAEEGTAQFSFVYTPLDLIVLLNTQFDLSEYPGITDKQAFRIVVIPGDAVSEARTARRAILLNTLPYEEVVDMFGINDKHVPELQLK